MDFSLGNQNLHVSKIIWFVDSVIYLPVQKDWEHNFKEISLRRVVKIKNY